MKTAVLVNVAFDGAWPLAADHLRRLCREAGEDIRFVRSAEPSPRPTAGALLGDAAKETERLVCLGTPLTSQCLAKLSALKRLFVAGAKLDDVVTAGLEARGVSLLRHPSEGFWGQSVAEYALALTLCGLRRIPQLHQAMQADLSVWDYSPPDGEPGPGRRGAQLGDGLRFANGTVAEKRVRVVGMGNIASRYADWTSVLGADVAAWDPFAPEPSFHLSGARRRQSLEALVRDAEIFAPMLPLNESTKGIVEARHIDALPSGCLVVLVTRAGICDSKALRRRVLAEELSLAADVFDVEPLPPDDPLLGRPNVVHTPHNAGRTVHANEQFAQGIFDLLFPDRR